MPILLDTKKDRIVVLTCNVVGRSCFKKCNYQEYAKRKSEKF